MLIQKFENYHRLISSLIKAVLDLGEKILRRTKKRYMTFHYKIQNAIVEHE